MKQYIYLLLSVHSQQNIAFNFTLTKIIYWKRQFYICLLHLIKKKMIDQLLCNVYKAISYRCQISCHTSVFSYPISPWKSPKTWWDLIQLNFHKFVHLQINMSKPFVRSSLNIWWPIINCSGLLTTRILLSGGLS